MDPPPVPPPPIPPPPAYDAACNYSKEPERGSQNNNQAITPTCMAHLTIGDDNENELTNSSGYGDSGPSAEYPVAPPPDGFDNYDPYHGERTENVAHNNKIQTTSLFVPRGSGFTSPELSGSTGDDCLRSSTGSESEGDFPAPPSPFRSPGGSALPSEAEQGYGSESETMTKTFLPPPPEFAPISEDCGIDSEVDDAHSPLLYPDREQDRLYKSRPKTITREDSFESTGSNVKYTSPVVRPKNQYSSSSVRDHRLPLLRTLSSDLPAQSSVHSSPRRIYPSVASASPLDSRAGFQPVGFSQPRDDSSDCLDFSLDSGSQLEPEFRNENEIQFTPDIEELTESPQAIRSYTDPECNSHRSVPDNNQDIIEFTDIPHLPHSPGHKKQNQPQIQEFPTFNPDVDKQPKKHDKKGIQKPKKRPRRPKTNQNYPICLGVSFTTMLCMNPPVGVVAVFISYLSWKAFDRNDMKSGKFLANVSFWVSIGGILFTMILIISLLYESAIKALEEQY